MGFFAALGVQVAFANEDEQPRLWWSEDVTPHAVVDEAFPVERITARAMEAFAHWRRQPGRQSQTDGRIENAEGG